MQHVKFFIDGADVKHIPQQFELESIQEVRSLHEVFRKKGVAGVDSSLAAPFVMEIIKLFA